MLATNRKQIPVRIPCIYKRKKKSPNRILQGAKKDEHNGISSKNTFQLHFQHNITFLHIYAQTLTNRNGGNRNKEMSFMRKVECSNVWVRKWERSIKKFAKIFHLVIIIAGSFSAGFVT